MKRTVAVILVLLAVITSWAQEFWLQPQKFYFTIREVANIRFKTGEYFSGENRSGNREKTQLLLHYTPSGQAVDIGSSLPAGKGDSLQVPLREEGTHMVVFNSTNSLNSTEPGRFHAYLEAEGLEHAIRYRRTHGEEQQKGNEYYQQSIKTIFQVGGKITDACLQPTTLPLDIVPEENPYAVPRGIDSRRSTRLRFQVLFNNEPLVNTLVKTWYQTPARELRMDTVRTNRRGWVTVERHSGPFMVSCVYMERNKPATDVQWQSYRASLCFEYSQFYTGKNRN